MPRIQEKIEQTSNIFYYNTISLSLDSIQLISLSVLNTLISKYSILHYKKSNTGPKQVYSMYFKETFSFNFVLRQMVTIIKLTQKNMYIAN